MNRRRAWWATLAALLGAVTFVAWIPGYRLEREIAAARAEGVWTEPGDLRKAMPPLPEAENAAGPIRTAIAADLADGQTHDPGAEAAVDVVRGSATEAQMAELRASLTRAPDRVARWRTASLRPRLDYGRPWEKGGAIPFPELTRVKNGGRLLVAAARVGLTPRENLVAAARLSDLTRQEPTLVAALVATEIGRSALREAKRQGLGREVAAALGPPIDARRIYRGWVSGTLDVMRRLGTRAGEREILGGELGFWDRLRLTGALGANRTRRMVRDYRGLWRDLPTDGTDYPRVKAAVDRWLGPAEGEIAAVAPQYSLSARDLSKPVDLFASFARERAATMQP